MKKELENIDKELLIDVRNLSKCYHLYNTPHDRLFQIFSRGRKKYYSDFWALKGVTLQIRRGEAIGIIGRNGAGKSTLLQMITGTLTPTSGEISVHGKIAALLQLGSGFNPDFTGRENVYLNGAILGFTRADIRKRFDEISAFADIGEYIDQPVKTYSSGMVMRLAFAVSTCLEPDILIVDEALAVGDVVFQRKCYSRLDEFIAAGGTLLFVSHSLELVKRICDKAIYLKNGEIRMQSTPAQVAAAYEFDLDAEIRKQKSDLPDLPEELQNLNDYGDKKAEIIEVWIESHEGERINSIFINQNFNWCYKVKFNSSIDKCNFGMKLVSTDGLILFGTNSEISAISLVKCFESETKIIKFELRSNPLTPGDYFLSAGVSENIDGNDYFLHRRTDSFHLKIRGTEQQNYVGIIDMSAQQVIS